jgi:hypothetical protein
MPFQRMGRKISALSVVLAPSDGQRLLFDCDTPKNGSVEASQPICQGLPLVCDDVADAIGAFDTSHPVPRLIFVCDIPKSGTVDGNHPVELRLPFVGPTSNEVAL